MDSLNVSYQGVIKSVIKNKLIDGATTDNYDWVINNVDKILTLAKSKKALETRRMYALAFGRLIKALGDDHKTMPLIAKPLYEYVVTLNDKVRDECDNQTLTKHRINNYVNYDTLERKRDQLGKAFNDNPNDNGLNISYLIMCLYTYQPPLRDDYYSVQIHKEKADLPTTINYLIHGSDGMYTFFLNYDKMINKKKACIYKWSEQLSKIVNHSLKMFPRKYLLVDSEGGPLKKNNVTQMMYRIFKNEGKRISLYNFRSAYITDFYSGNNTLKDKHDLAEKMRNTRGIAEKYYQKIIKDDDKLNIHIDELGPVPVFNLIKRLVKK